MHAPSDTWFVKAVALCCASPDIAIGRMEKFNAERGTEALVAKLQAKPNYFGKSAPFRDLREVKQAAALLPLLAMTELRFREAVELFHPEADAA